MNPYIAIIARKKAGGGGGGGGAVFASDTFTGSDGTNLTAHTGEVGATWAKVTGVTGDFKITGNKAKGDSGGHSAYYASGSPDTAEYDVEVDMHKVSSVDYPSIAGRMDTSADTCYALMTSRDNTGWTLFKVVAGTETSLGTYTDTIGNGEDRHMKLEIRDAAKKAFIDGVERISSADNAITAAGKAGIRTENSDWGLGSTGKTFDTFVATNA